MIAPAMRWIWFAGLFLFWTQPAFAHREPQEPIRLAVSPDRLELTTQASLRAVVLSTGLRPSDGSYYSPAELARAARAHADYLLSHLRVRANTRLLSGKIVVAAPLEPLTRPLHRTVDLDDFHARYVLEYQLAEPPSWLSVEQNVLAEFEERTGSRWRQQYFVSVVYAGEPRVVATGILTHELGFDFIPRWSGAGTTRRESATEVRAGSYFTSGLLHILRGWDHLLFVGALAIAARRLLDLVKVVAAFTLAHSVTLTLAALGLLSLPPWLVEPLIAASILVVSLDNLRHPEHAATRLRLATAFGFGLVHGLGFAGPLVDALSGVTGLSLAKAILAFSTGVEVGHQLVVIPLFVLVTWLAEQKPDRGPSLALRYGSIATAIGGAIFLVQAVSAYVAG